MKSILLVTLVALSVSSSFAVRIKGKCPNPTKPKVDYWHFTNLQGTWTVLGRSEETVPRTVHNTIYIDNFYPGKAVVIEKGNTRDREVLSRWDKYITMTVGDFNGKSYYEFPEGEEPYSFNIKTSDGHRGQFWVPYFARPKYAEAVLASCVKINDSTVDVKAWFVSMTKGVSASQEVKNLIKSLTGQEYVQVCQGDFC